MTLRMFLLSAVVAAFGGLLVAYQLDTRTIDLATTSASVQARDAYLEDARDGAPELWAATDQVLLRTGLGLCAAIRQIPDPQVAPRPVSGLTANELRAITDAATSHLCATARPRVTDYLNRSAR
ncbi:hypothetical protein [Actinomadura bangladeshensis]|uniref:Uncharacterized protein n=1 Tax=Actinomadura bangladeshensis TaxID=453573 RepID=A0A6L9Q7X7_9ACTN|nr:hypothetical protein [Actinomadura bangladeshensis]NEA21557.1 hypothetical protein [Actinomadura bangladeshensis]NEA22517.1 hypothetical protein [Actinomadura bangladeshensis]